MNTATLEATQLDGELGQKLTAVGTLRTGPACPHVEVEFRRGTFHLVCTACGRHWQATQQPVNIMPDYTAMGETLPDTVTVRRHPFHLPTKSSSSSKS